MKPTEPSSINTLDVSDLTAALDFFVLQLGFRVEMIVPADDPHTAVICGQGLRLRLHASDSATPSDLNAITETNRPVISRLSNSAAWHVGRAGMEYRDLIPGRLGERVIASHIRIPAGGPVPDYVHYHKVQFQMIYCKAGWVRVVYEDQGAPFVLEAGDCVLQPPEIRHRVLEASPGLEVIELGVPAVHETWADHELSLPTPQTNTMRSFFGQQFVRHQASAAEWLPWRMSGFVARDTGIASATKGLATVQVVRADAPVAMSAHTQAGEFLFFFILSGQCQIDNVAELNAGDSCVIPAEMVYTLRATAGLEMLEVSLPKLLN